MKFIKLMLDLTPQVGFEPTTNRLTADRSTPELLRIFKQFIYILLYHLFDVKSVNYNEELSFTILLLKFIFQTINDATLCPFSLNIYIYQERVTRFERATSTLARLRSTPELHPLTKILLHRIITN